MSRNPVANAILYQNSMWLCPLHAMSDYPALCLTVPYHKYCQHKRQTVVTRLVSTNLPVPLSVIKGSFDWQQLLGQWLDCDRRQRGL